MLNKHLTPPKKETNQKHSPSSTLRVFCISLGANSMRPGAAPEINRKKQSASHEKLKDAALI